MQTYVGRATVSVHSEATSYTSGSYLAGCRVQMFSASADFTHTSQWQAELGTAQPTGSLEKSFTAVPARLLRLLSGSGVGLGSALPFG